jgi:DNA-binding protein HU-beta
MTKQEFIKGLSEKLSVKKAQANEIYDSVMAMFEEAVSQKEEVVIGKIGKIKYGERKERNGVNPRTKEKLVIPATKVPKFVFSSKMKDLVKA